MDAAVTVADLAKSAVSVWISGSLGVRLRPAPYEPPSCHQEAAAGDLQASRHSQNTPLKGRSCTLRGANGGALLRHRSVESSPPGVEHVSRRIP